MSIATTSNVNVSMWVSGFARVLTRQEKTETAETRAGHLRLLQEQSLKTTVVCLEAYMVRRCKKTLTDDNIQKEMRACSHEGVKKSGTRN